jgi:serine/threonine-protein kinase
MGEVYVAEHVGIQTRVAIKVLLPEISKHDGHVQRLFNEARIVSRIKHAGIAKIFDVGFHDGQAYLVMEFLEGEPLSSRIGRGRIPVGEVAELGRQIASVLAATHAEGVTHRDLKPDNIFLVGDAELERRERVKVLDFGIAKLPGSVGPRTIGTMGTPEYMAPEQWGDSGSVDWRADAYSLGCVLFEMLTGRPPFPSSTIVEAYTQHTQSAAPQLRTLVHDVPVELERLVDQLLAKNPGARGESMKSIVRALEPFTSATFTPPHGVPVVRTQPRSVTTLGGGAGQVVRIESAKRTGFIAAAAAIAAVAVIALVSVRTVSGAHATRAASARAVVETAPVERAVDVAPAAVPSPAPAVAAPPTTPTPAPSPTPTSAASTTPTSPRSSGAAPALPRSAPTRAPKIAPAPTPAATPAPAAAPHDELEGRT